MHICFAILCAIASLAPTSGEGHALETQVPAPSAPLAFLENRGQVPGEAAFVGRLPGVVVRAEPSALALQVEAQGNPKEGVLVRLEFEGAR
ncbi:MAG TPA: hypothetical protein VMS76_14990, partial [Planctomycetota bacterium]|nr:hypothetical protein [Planctomycetota bacterium]